MCQIEYINKMDCKDFFTQKVEQLLIFLEYPRTSIAIFLTKIKKNKTFKTSDLKGQNKRFSEKEHSKNLMHPPSSDFKEGDLVKVCSKEQILQTLDKNNKLNGCHFMDEMWKYCNSQQKVLKKIEYFYDEANLRMCKARNTVLLKDLYCSGDLQRFEQGCDRCCLFFWRTEWLGKIE